MNEECSYCYEEECECQPCPDCGEPHADCWCNCDDWYDDEGEEDDD